MDLCSYVLLFFTASDLTVAIGHIRNCALFLFWLSLFIPSGAISVVSAPTLWRAAVDPGLCQRLLDTHRQVWLSLFCGHCSFLLGPGVHKGFFVPFKSLFPLSCRSSVIKSCWPSKSNPWGSQSLCQIPSLRKLLRALELLQQTGQELLWCNCSLVCGSSAW